MKPAPGIPNWTPKPATAQKKSGPEWWHWLIAIVIVVGWVILSGANKTSRDDGKSAAAIAAEGKAITDDMERFNKNPNRTVAEKAAIERRRQEFMEKNSPSRVFRDAYNGK